MPRPLSPDSASPQELASGTWPRPECSQAWQLPEKVLHFLDDLPGLTSQLGAGGQAGSEPRPVGCSRVFPCGLIQGSSLTFLCYFVKQGAVGLACRPCTLGVGSVNSSGIAQFCRLPQRLPDSWELGEPSPPHPRLARTPAVCRRVDGVERSGGPLLSRNHGLTVPELGAGHGCRIVVSCLFIPRGVGLVLGAQCLRCWPPQRVLAPPGQPWGPLFR